MQKNTCRSQQQATWHRDTRGRLNEPRTSDRSGWGIIVKQGGRTVYEDSGANRVATSSLTMEVGAVTHTIQWLASPHPFLQRPCTQITHVTSFSLADSMNLLQKVESRMGYPDRHTAMRSLWLQNNNNNKQTKAKQTNKQTKTPLLGPTTLAIPESASTKAVNGQVDW